MDVAIDRAAREMLDVEPPAGLRGRVLCGIENSVSLRHRVASGFSRKIEPAWKVLLPVATAAVLILAVLAPWRTQSPSPIVTAPPQVAAAQPPPIDPPNGAQPEATVTAPSRRRPAAESMVQTPARVVTSAPDRVVTAAVYRPAEPVGDELEPLGTITPIQINPIADQQFAPAAIAVRPLNPITDVQIAPLTPPERRN